MRKTLPPYIQRGLLALIILLMGISVARVLVRVHQTEELLQQLDAENTALANEVNRLSQKLEQYHEQSQNQHAPRRDFGYASTDKGKGGYSSQPRLSLSRKLDVDADTLTKAMSTAHERIAATYKDAYKGQQKFTEPHKFRLNSIDSSTLVRIPGIGAKTAATIMRYRERYGGFYSPWQLQDFLTWDAAQAYMQEWCTMWFEANATEVHHLAINQCTISEMVRHPYISYDQAVKIAQYRSRHNRINKMEELESSSIFTPDEAKRLSYYLSFD